MGSWPAATAWSTSSPAWSASRRTWSLTTWASCGGPAWYRLAQLRRRPRRLLLGRSDPAGPLLTSTGGALHPGLRLARPLAPRGSGRAPRGCCSCAPATAPGPRWPRRCQPRSGGVVQACSAGSHPKPLHPQRGPGDAGRLRHRPRRGRRTPARVRRRPLRPGHQLLRPRAEVCPEFPGGPRPSTGASPTPPPAEPTTTTGYPAFEQTAADLETRIGFLLAALADPNPPSRQPGGAMTELNEIVNVRYMVDDVRTVDRLLHQHLDFELRTIAAPGFADVTRGNLRLLCAAPPARPDGPCPTAPSLVRGLEPHPPARRRHRRGGRPAARGRPEFRNDIVTGPGGPQILPDDPSGNVSSCSSRRAPERKRGPVARPRPGAAARSHTLKRICDR